jgi:hypothetical protein
LTQKKFEPSKALSSLERVQKKLKIKMEFSNNTTLMISHISLQNLLKTRRQEVHIFCVLFLPILIKYLSRNFKASFAKLGAKIRAPLFGPCSTLEKILSVTRKPDAIKSFKTKTILKT